MDISNLSSGYMDYSKYLTDKVKSAEKVTESLNLSQDATDEEMMNACKEFEQYFMEKIYNSMLETTKLFSDEDESDSYASKMVDYFKDTAVSELTKASSKQGGVGLAKQLFEQMKRQNNGIKPEALE